MAKDKFLLASEINPEELLLLNEGIVSVIAYYHYVIPSTSIQKASTWKVVISIPWLNWQIKEWHDSLPYLTGIDLNDRYKGSVKPIAEPPTRQVNQFIRVHNSN